MSSMGPVMNDPPLGPLLGVGNRAEVFTCGALVVKLYKSIAPKHSAFREAAILAAVEALGLPVPVIYGVQRFGDRWGVLMSRVEGPSLADAMTHQPAEVPASLTRMAELHLRVHGHPAAQFASLKARLAANIQQASVLGEPRRSHLLAGLARMPDGHRLCHGDFHPHNIMGPPGNEVVIDWLDASRGDPAADVCRSCVLLRPIAPDMAAAYIDTYAEVSGTGRDAIVSWLPFVAAARLAEVVPEADELMRMVETTTISMA